MNPRLLSNGEDTFAVSQPSQSEQTQPPEMNVSRRFGVFYDAT